MPFGKHKSHKIQTDHLPGPIATSYRRIFTRHEPDVERLMFVLDTAEITARFLSAVVLCTLRELAQEGKVEPPLVDLGEPRTRLKKPSFGLWMEILREGARRLHGHEDWFTDEAAARFAKLDKDGDGKVTADELKAGDKKQPEMAETIIKAMDKDKDGSLTQEEFVDGARSLAMDVCGFVFNEQQKTKGRPYADLEAIVVIRNKVHHPAEELDIPSLCEEAEKLINQALSPLEFFENYTPYVVKQINVRRRRMSSPAYQHQCFLLQGEIDFPEAESDLRDWHTETSDVLVYRGPASYLNLDPLFVYLHADEIDKIKVGSSKSAEELYPGMYCFAGFSSKSSGIVVDYLPCAGSAKSFRTSNQAFRDADTTSCLNQGVEQLLELLGKSPTPETADA